jgi:sirohydrochlorin ferrochelatase
MVGRGTSEQAALDHMRRLTELRVSDGSTSVVVHETGFFAGGKPNVDALLDLAAGWDCDTVIVQAHLLFEGDLIEQLRNKVLNRRDSCPGKQWFVSRTLGADPMLANVFLDLAKEALFRNEVSDRTDD